VQLDASTPTVGGLVTSDPILVWPDTPVAEVADLLDRSGISGVPVVDWSGYLVGVVSRMDLLRVRESDSLWADWSRLCARHIMSQVALMVTVDTPVDDAVRLMESRRVHRLVVVADDGESPIGVLSATDLVRGMADGAAGPSR
jgi:CBS domain-containing protein